MESDIYQQIFRQLVLARKILITLPQTFTADGLASGLALKLFLQKMEKDVELVSSGAVPATLAFLPGVADLKSELAAKNSLTVILDTSTTQLEEMSYQAHKDQVHIFLKAKNGSFTPEDVSFSAEQFPVDAIIILEADSLEDLGDLFEKNTSLFYETPKINISHKAGNEYFGAINLVDIAASSIAEILSSLFEKYEQQLVDEDIATCLLAGIITKTNSFQRVQTTPSAFLKASELISLGGRHSEIIRHFYKTKPLAVLKLWGNALTHLKQDESLSTIYAVVSHEDLQRLAAKPEDLPLVLLELANVVAEHKFVGLLVEISSNQVDLLAAVKPEVSAEKLGEEFGAKPKISEHGLGSLKMLEFELFGISLAQAESKLLQVLRNL